MVTAKAHSAPRRGGIPVTISQEDWSVVRRIVPRTIRSSLHCSITSLNPDGSPHVSPIGSFLPTDNGHGIYFDAFNVQLAANLRRDPRVSILAVDSGPFMWARSLMKGRFTRPPGIRMTGTVGPPRRSTPSEVRRFHRLVGPLLRTRGGKLMWTSLPIARDVKIEYVEPIWMGSMTPEIDTPKRSR
ncbi:pyridoxamine 5'-phosphate oxidase family protein [Gulosibacter molinativorax]|uniref:Pyridoxamine 5'-phosphate oxidase family protein n=2 Tax=Gulosibacter molinativorax TaxID=256821 RepID=A0ABT7C5L9_9MICO|nr:pyridoxamine 5'-phosphate oxidase family protein [Gulosibacter molinativorax]